METNLNINIKMLKRYSNNNVVQLATAMYIWCREKNILNVLDYHVWNARTKYECEFKLSWSFEVPYNMKFLYECSIVLCQNAKIVQCLSLTFWFYDFYNLWHIRTWSLGVVQYLWKGSVVFFMTFLSADL